jgi:DNA polymerase-1
MSAQNPEQTLLLVDGSSYLYRAFHALPELRNAAGEPTGAIYGVLAMLRKLAADHPAGARACVFDAKGKTFRDAAYPEYKATRTAMPDDLAQQVEPLCKAVEDIGWPVLVIDGVEADDVIATLAEQAKTRGWRTVISTGDKDLTQLVDAQTLWVNTMSNEKLDAAGVAQKFGVPPERIVDYLALIGDTIDNIPGVDKVGPKTALKWIQQYGSLDGVIGHADEIGGAVGENLRKALDWLPKARELLTVKRDVPLQVGLEDLAVRPADPARLRSVFERFGFKTWLKESQKEAHQDPQAPRVDVAEPIAQPPAKRDKRTVATLLTEVELEALRARLETAELVGLEVLCTSSEPMNARLVGIAFALEREALYLPLAHDYPGAPEQLGAERALGLLRGWLERDDRRKVAQNVKFARHVFANHGVALGGAVHDTLLESYVLEVHERRDIAVLASRHCGWSVLTLEEVTGKGVSRIAFESVEVDRATRYAAEAADCALTLHEILYARIAADEKLRFVYTDIEMAALPVLQRVERNGVLLDSEKLVRQSHELGKEILDKEQQAFAIAGGPFNLGSPKQIREILFDRQKLPVRKKTPTGEPSTDEDVLAELALDHPLPKLILEHRALAKLKSTYTDKLPKSVQPGSGRVHTNYSQTTAVTGRLSSNDPNLQNIPIRTPQGRRIREAFIAPPGSAIMSADYSQIELRIMAHLSGDASLRQAFARGDDVHRATAAEVFGTPLESVSNDERRAAKVINFGLIYGMSAFGVAQNLGIERSTAQAYIDSYFARYPGVKRYMDATREKARSLGYVETVFGRRLWLPEMKSGSPARRQAAERAAINAPMQGTAADLIKLAMIAVQRWLDDARLAAKLVMQVHDELVLEVPEAELDAVRAGLRERMQSVAALEVPLLVEVGAGPNWDRAQ